jgi:hypothetical protein
VKGAVTNPRELMENRFGGIVNVTRPDGVFPLPQASLNPFVFQTVQMLQANKEELTGVSQLSQGLDKDAVSKQNSQDMIHELITVSQIRQKIVARNFAEFLRDLYAEVHRLVAENEDAEKIVEIAGKWTPIDFTAWPQDCKMTVSFALGYGEEKREAQKWMGVNALLSQIPQLAPQYGPAQAYQVVKNAMLAAGIKDVDTYLLPPEKATQPPPNPMLQAEIALKQADAASKQAAAQATVQSFQLQQAELASKERLETARIQVELKRLELEMTKLAQAKGIEQDKLAHKVIVDNAEIILQEKALANDKLQAEAMPTRS